MWVNFKHLGSREQCSSIFLGHPMNRLWLDSPEFVMMTHNDVKPRGKSLYEKSISGQIFFVIWCKE